MAQGRAVIGSHPGGIAEAITHQQTGLLVPPGDPVSLAHAMHRLVSTAAMRQTLADAAFHHVRDHLNARIQSTALEELLLQEID